MFNSTKAMSFSINFILLLVILHVNKCCSYTQYGYKLRNDRVEVVSCNEHLAKIKLYNTKYNRTTRSFGALVEFFEDLHPTKFRFTVQGYRYINNEYKIYPPVRFTVNTCMAKANNWFKMSDFTTTNGNFTVCPQKKGIYYLKDYVPPADNFPPQIPEQEAKATLNFTTNGVELFTIAWYGALEKIKLYK